MTIRVVLADDQPLVRGGFAVFVNAAPDMTVVGEAGDGQRAVDLARSERADVVVMDIRMPGTDGITATATIAADEDLSGVRVLILTTFELDENVLRALRAGASGFLSKSVDPADLQEAIRVVARGEALLSPRAVQSLITRFLQQPGPGFGAPPSPKGFLVGRQRQGGQDGHDGERDHQLDEREATARMGGRVQHAADGCDFRPP